MDDPRQARGASALPLQKSQDARTPPVPANFTPLRLVLVPSGMRIEMLKADNLIGRHDSADVRLPLPDVSRRHCRFVFGPSGWSVLDLNSLNGVFVNNKRVSQVVLRHGDRIRIGGFAFQVDLPSAALPVGPSAATPTSVQGKRRAS